MFMAYAIGAGLLAGRLLGGSLANLGTLRIRWAPLALAGLLIQLVLFFQPMAERVGALGTPIYVGSTALVLVVVLRNLHVPGLVLVAAGAISNLLAIVANGGSMPASPAALAFLGATVNRGYSNSAVVESPALAPLTDIFALPPSLPFANVFSIGDVLISVGVAVVIAAGMRGGAPGKLPPTYPRPGTTES
jgi:lipoprotein signal peptidase